MDREAFDAIVSHAIPNILKDLKPGEELKVWVAGYTPGEEVYSIAILIANSLPGPMKTLL